MTRTAAAVSLAIALLLPALAHADSAPVFSTEQGAVRGYDVVAYFTEGKPVAGKKEFIAKWKGATWYFASAANRDAFRAAPKKYAPQYGGYCAYGVSQGHTAPTDPTAWTVVDGKLYLNYSLDVRAEWKKDIAGYVAKANHNWPTVLTR